MSNEFRHATGAPTVRAIVNATARYYGLDVAPILSARRHEPYVLARHVASFIASRHTSNSLPMIGQALGNRDHTTVLHGVKKVERERRANPRLRSDIAAIEESLGLVACAENLPAAAVDKLSGELSRTVNESLRLTSRLKEIVAECERPAGGRQAPDPAHALQDRVVAAARAVAEAHDEAATVAANRVATTTFNRALVALKQAVAAHDAAGLSFPPAETKGETDGIRH